MGINKARFDAAVARFEMMGIKNRIVDEVRRNILCDGWDIFIVKDICGNVTPETWVEAINFIKLAGGKTFVYAESSTACMRYLCSLLSIAGVQVLYATLVSLSKEVNKWELPVQGLVIGI